MNWYPIKLTYEVRQYSFGERLIPEILGKTGLPDGTVAETWEVSDYRDARATIRNGELEGMAFHDIVARHAEEIVGTSWSGPHYPLLGKFLDASHALPVHLHADDETAARVYHEPNGKTESWHILWAEPNASILAGVKPGTTESQLRDAFARQDYGAVMPRHPIQAGDTVYVPGGTLHSFGPGTLILPPSLRGELSIDGQFSGPFSSPEATANILGLGEYLGEPWHIQGDVSYGKAQVVLSEVKLLWAGRNQLTADGSLSEQALDLEVRAQAVLMDFEEWIRADIADSGELSLWATVKGTPKDPDLAGELKIGGRAPALSDDALVQSPLSLLLTWQTRAGNLDINLDARHGSREAADAEATLAIAPILEQLFREKPAGESPPLPVDLRASGQADLAALGAFFDPEIHTMRGRLDFNLTADGTTVAPNARGNINLRDGYYEHRPSNTRLRGIVFVAELSPEAWRIVEASARDGDRGRVDVQGAVRFNAPAPPALDFSLTAKNAHLLNMPGAKGAFRGELRLSGTTEDALLAGTLNLRPLAVQVEHFIGSSVPEIDVIEVEVYGGESEEGPALMENIELALKVVLDQQSYVRGLGLDSELKGEVDIAGTAADPQASGTLTIVRGTFDLLGKKFELQEGEVQFENNVAAIYVKGVHTYPEGEITAEISGTTDDPKIEFSSDPDAAQDEIFAQLLFGKSLTDISPLQAVRLVGVVRTLQTGNTGFDPLASTRDLVGLDTLDVETEATDEGDQYSLSLGKYITSRIYLELQRSTDPLNPWQAEMQIELRKNLRLDIKSSDNEESGGGSVELQWKKDY